MRFTAVASLACIFTIAFVACGASTDGSPVDSGFADGPALAVETGTGDEKGADARDSATASSGDATADQATGADSSSKPEAAPDAKTTFDANASCPSSCQSSTECQALCPTAPGSRANCCDLGTHVCYVTTPGGSC